MKYYYLIEGKIMSANWNMPDRNDDAYITSWHKFNNDKYNLDVKIWYSSLQTCEISESELTKIEKHIDDKLKLDSYDLSNPIDVTDIISDNNGVISFKQPKQVEEIESVGSYENQLKLLRELRQIDVIQGASFALNKFTIKRK